MADFEIQNGVLIRYHGENRGAVVIPDNVTAIGDWAFAFCNSLQKITIPAKCTFIGHDIFKDCLYLKTLKIGDHDCSFVLKYYRDKENFDEILKMIIRNYNNYKL
ncbi:MAG: leucine-rich repeat domain-containing protein [Oscillospiraceae bacterium]|nr:leucine-rich repeat domain-containing protein [Oscillospiraceae bacterium]